MTGAIAFSAWTPYGQNDMTNNSTDGRDDFTGSGVGVVDVEELVEEAGVGVVLPMLPVTKINPIRAIITAMIIIAVINSLFPRTDNEEVFSFLPIGNRSLLVHLNNTP
jgi:hypothetical protein